MNEKVLFEKALEDNDYLFVNTYIKQAIDNLKHFLKRQDLVALEKFISSEKTWFSYLIKKEIQQKNIHYLFGRYMGFSEAIYDQLESQYKERSFKECLQSCDIAEIPHVNEIIVTIHQNEGIRHGKLAEKVGIEKSTLTGIMEKLVQRGAVQFTRPGKYKYYYLTDLGYKYYNDNRAIIETSTNIDALTEQLLIALSKEEDATNKLIEILVALHKGQNTYKGYSSKTKEKVDPSRIFAGLPSIKQLNVLFSDSSLHTVNNAVVVEVMPDMPIIYLIDNNDNSLIECPEISISSLIN